MSAQTVPGTETFTLSLQLHHPSCDPELITEKLGIKPVWKLKAGQTVGSLTRKTTVWNARFAEGQSENDFSAALDGIIGFLADHADFLRTLVAEEGDIMMQLNVPSCGSGFVLSTVKFAPYFLEALATHSIGLQVQTVTDAEEADEAYLCSSSGSAPSVRTIYTGFEEQPHERHRR